MIRIFLLILFTSLVVTTHGQESIEPQQTIDLEITYDRESSSSNFFSIQPLILSFEEDNPQILKLSVIYYEFHLYTIKVQDIYYDLLSNDKTIQEFDNLEYLISNSKSPIPIVDDQSLFEEFQTSSEQHGNINYAMLSPDENLLIAIHSKIIDPRGGGYRQTNVAIWERDSQPEILVDTYGDTFEVLFSPLENYFYSRGNNFDEFGEESISEFEFRMVLDANMINLNTLEEIEANADVAFTSDERYFVTERDEVPTLVDTDTDENLLHYDMPVRMVGATFSPDDQTLYLTGLDNNLYVFVSNLPTQVDDWMLR